MLLLTTVPHTGTRFWLDILERVTRHKHHVIRRSTQKHIRPVPLASCHIEPRNYRLMERYIAKHEPLIITTTRDHDATVKSWRKRGLSLRRYHWGQELQQRLIRDHSPLVVSVDAPDREVMLNELAERLGTEITTDWRPVGSYICDGEKQDGN